MSEFIKVYQCERCGMDIHIEKEGDPKNPDGTWKTSAKYFIVDKAMCPKCQKKRR